eukprot:m.27388 g.27388  ORF g.27388 m.27388 type:complete len:639 (+) comp7889_c0_seq1:226-2142(+)
MDFKSFLQFVSARMILVTLVIALVAVPASSVNLRGHKGSTDDMSPNSKSASSKKMKMAKNPKMNAKGMPQGKGGKKSKKSSRKSAKETQQPPSTTAAQDSSSMGTAACFENTPKECSPCTVPCMSGGKSLKNHQQESVQWLSIYINPGEPLTVHSLYGRGSVYGKTLSANSNIITVTCGGYSLTSADGRSFAFPVFEDSAFCTIADGGGAVQQVYISLNCKYPFSRGDRFGSLYISGFQTASGATDDDICTVCERCPQSTTSGIATSDAPTPPPPTPPATTSAPATTSTPPTTAPPTTTIPITTPDDVDPPDFCKPFLNRQCNSPVTQEDCEIPIFDGGLGPRPSAGRYPDDLVFVPRGNVGQGRPNAIGQIDGTFESMVPLTDDVGYEDCKSDPDCRTPYDDPVFQSQDFIDYYDYGVPFDGLFAWDSACFGAAGARVFPNGTTVTQYSDGGQQPGAVCMLERPILNCIYNGTAYELVFCECGVTGFNYPQCGSTDACDPNNRINFESDVGGKRTKTNVDVGKKDTKKKKGGKKGNKKSKSSNLETFLKYSLDEPWKQGTLAGVCGMLFIATVLLVAKQRRNAKALKSETMSEYSLGPSCPPEYGTLPTDYDVYSDAYLNDEVASHAKKSKPFTVEL